MKTFLLVVLSILIITSPVLAADGMVNVLSRFSVTETANRFETVLQQKGMTVFNRIEHSAAAAKVGVTLRDTELIIFGNPNVGSPLMACQQTVAIDLPQKAVIWKDSDEKVWISYNDPKYLVKRHNIKGCEGVIGKVTKALAGLTNAAAK